MPTNPMEEHGYLQRLVEAKEDGAVRDHMHDFRVLSGIRPPLPSLEEARTGTTEHEKRIYKMLEEGFDPLGDIEPGQGAVTYGSLNRGDVFYTSEHSFVSKVSDVWGKDQLGLKVQMSPEIEVYPRGSAGFDAKVQDFNKRMFKTESVEEASRGNWSGSVDIQLNGDPGNVARQVDDEDYPGINAREVARRFIDLVKHEGRSMRSKGSVFKVTGADYNTRKGVVSISWEQIRGKLDNGDDVLEAAEEAIAGRSDSFDSGLIKDVADRDEIYAALIYGHPHEGHPPRIVDRSVDEPFTYGESTEVVEEVAAPVTKVIRRTWR